MKEGGDLISPRTQMSQWISVCIDAYEVAAFLTKWLNWIYFCI